MSGGLPNPGLSFKGIGDILRKLKDKADEKMNENKKDKADEKMNENKKNGDGEGDDKENGDGGKSDGGTESTVQVIETDENGEERAREMRLDELLGPRAPDPRPPAINLDDLQQQDPPFEIRRRGEEEPPKEEISDKLSRLLNLGNKPDPDVNKGAVETSVGGNPNGKQKGFIFRRGRGKKGMGHR